MSLEKRVCRCIQCEASRRKLAGLSRMVGFGDYEHLNRYLVEALNNHTKVVNSELEVISLEYSNIFFPTPFQRFLLTGEVPSLSVIAQAMGYNFPTSITDGIRGAIGSLLHELLTTDADIPADFAPVFVVGCGRSGTTLLTQLLACHPRVVDINEARSVWLTVPQLDVWSIEAEARGGMLICNSLSECELRKLHRQLFACVLLSPKALQLCIQRLVTSHEDVLRVAKDLILVEKLPENVHRIGMLRQLFPACQIIHISREKSAVTRSIAKFSPIAWYGATLYKWRRLCSEFGGSGSCNQETMLACAELEWEAARSAITAYACDPRLLCVAFNDLVLAPDAVWRDICAVLDAQGISPLTDPELAQLETSYRLFKASLQRDKAGS